MTSISPARFALAVLLAGFAVGEAHAQPAKPTGDTAGGSTEPAGAKESSALAEARALFIEGDAHYKAGRYALAAERFIKAFELSGKPALLFNLANTYERAGNYEKAAHYLRMYLEGGEVHDVASVRARLQRLELTVIEQKKSGDNAGATQPSTPPVADAGDTSAPPAKQPSRVPYYVAGGGVVVGAAAAIVFGLKASSERSDIDALCVDQGSGVICPPQADSHLTNERRYALISDIGIGVAAASVATGLVYYLVTRDGRAAREPERQALSIVPSASGDGFGVVAVGRF